MEFLCGKAIQFTVLVEKSAVWRCFQTTAKRGIETNTDWGEPDAAWEGPEPIGPPSLAGTGDDMWRD